MSYPFLSDVVKAWTGYDVPLPLATFGLFVALGAMVAGACFHAELGRLYRAGKISAAWVRGAEVPPQQVVSDFMVVVMIAGVVGARLFHILEHTGQFMADPQAKLKTQGYYTYPVYPEDRPLPNGQMPKQRVPTAWRVGQYLSLIHI